MQINPISITFWFPDTHVKLSWNENQENQKRTCHLLVIIYTHTPFSCCCCCCWAEMFRHSRLNSRLLALAYYITWACLLRCDIAAHVDWRSVRASLKQKNKKSKKELFYFFEMKNMKTPPPLCVFVSSERQKTNNHHNNEYTLHYTEIYTTLASHRTGKRPWMCTDTHQRSPI